VITAAQLEPFVNSGFVAASKALHLRPATIQRHAKELGVVFASNNTLAQQYHKERARKAIAGKVRELARRRMTQAGMCKALGISRAELRRTAKEHRININSRQLY
jgi:hypothetical protein